MSLLFILVFSCYVLHSSITAPTKADVGWFWHITDIHYDSTYTTYGTSCKPFVPLEERGKFGARSCDPGWPLVVAAVEAMVDIKPDVDFVLWTGDDVMHEYHGTFIDRPILYDTIENITELFKSHLTPPLYPALGNNDIRPKNHYPPHNDPVYDVTWELWKGDLSRDQKDHWLQGGYYRHDVTDKCTVISLNTVLYHSPLNNFIKDPAGQFQWLEKQLLDMREEGRYGILIGHIGPGVSHKGHRTMHEAHNTRLLMILAQFSDVIKAMHVGHDHVDHFKVLMDDSGDALFPIFFALSVTPRKTGHNPGIRLVSYDRTTGQHLDLHQYTMDLDQANEEGKDTWTIVYKMTEAFDIPDISASSLASFWRDLKDDPAKAELLQKVKVADMDQEVECGARCRLGLYCNVGCLRHYHGCMNGS